MRRFPGRSRGRGEGADHAPADRRRAGVIISDDLPLTLFVAVATAVIMSALNAVPQMIFVGVVLAPLISDLLKNEVKHRGWGKRRLLALAGLLSMGGTARELARGRSKDASASSAEGPPLAGVCLTAVASSRDSGVRAQGQLVRARTQLRGRL